MLSSIFKLRAKATENIVALLSETTLGSNGALYAHLDVEKRINELDNPLFLSIERNEKVLGNITFCRRNENWYIRYFAFSQALQSNGKTKSKSSKTNRLKTELSQFFSTCLEEGYNDSEIENFYAYIDPANAKSLWMSENFGFKTIGKIATQSFSRISPKKSKRVEMCNNLTEIDSFLTKNFKKHSFFIDLHSKKPPFYIIRDENDDIIAFTKATIANWEIKRLPGKMGKLLVSIIPLVPGLRKIIRPKNHTFIVPEAVVIKNNDAELLSELFEGILALNQLNLMLWWVDEEEKVYQSVKGKIKWGILDKLIGVNHANLVAKSSSIETKVLKSPFYITGIDFI